METPSQIEIGIEIIRSKGSASGQDLAEALGCVKKNVQPMLYLALTMGYLATSKRDGQNIYRISEDVPAGMSWADFRLSKRAAKAKSAPVKAPSKAKVIVEKPERTPAEVRNALADLFERRALGLPADEDDVTASEAQAAPADAVGSAAQGYEVIELETGPDPDPAAVVEAPPITADKSTVQQVARDRHFGGCSYEASLLRRLLARIHRDDGKYLAEHGLDKAQDEAEKKIVQLFPLSEPTATSVAPPIDEVRFLFGCDGRLQVLLGDQRIICTREETAAVGRMMSALEPVWNV